MRLYPRERWLEVSDVLIFHGRRICNARRPRCEDCAVEDSARRRCSARSASAQRVDGHVTGSARPVSCFVTGRGTTLARWDGSSSSSTRTGWRVTPSACATTSRVAGCGSSGRGSSSGRETSWASATAPCSRRSVCWGSDDEQAERRLIDRPPAPAARRGAPAGAGRTRDRVDDLVGGPARSERRQQAAVVVVPREQIDAHLLDDARAMADRQRLVELADAPFQPVSTGFWPS
jgi:hypothetical protein